MKKYEILQLNKGISFSREKDLMKAQETINEKSEQGWELLQVISPDDSTGALYGIFVQEL